MAEFVSSIKTELLEELVIEPHTKSSQTNEKASTEEKSNIFQCFECDYRCRFRSLLKTHRRKHHEIDYKCSKCKHVLKTNSGLTKHMEENHGDICYICDLCNYNSKKKQAFISHKKNVHGGKQASKDLLKYPIPPKPVLSMSVEEIRTWFPSFFSKISCEIKARREEGYSLPVWIRDIEDVISLSSLKTVARNWNEVERSFYWKLKLVSAIVLDHKGFDYTKFALKVPKSYEKYSVSDLKIMSKAKNPSTFEKMFL